MTPVVRRLSVAAAAAAVCALPCVGSAGPGATLARLDVDPTFGEGGWALPVLRGPRRFQHVAYDSQDRVVVVGSTERRDVQGLRMVVRALRFLPDGRLDPTFGTLGVSVVVSHGWVTELLVDGSDRILVVGRFRGEGDAWASVLRLSADGTLDETFSGDGLAEVDEGVGQESAAVCLDPSDDSVVAVVGTRTWRKAVVRIDASGDLSPTFGDGGSVVLDDDPGTVQSVAVDADGGIVVGLHEACVRLHRDGARDVALGGDGILRGTDGRAAAGRVLRDAEGRIVVVSPAAVFHGGAAFDRELECWRFLPGGAPDHAFSEDGHAVVEPGRPADGSGPLVFAPSRGGADRWVVAGSLRYHAPDRRLIGSRLTGFGFFAQSIDPSAPDAVAALVSRTRVRRGFSAWRTPDGIVDAAVSADGTAACFVGERMRGHRAGKAPQLFRVSLSPGRDVPLPDLGVEWVGAPSVFPSDGVFGLRSRVRVTNSGPGRCLRGGFELLLSDDAVLDADDRRSYHDGNVPRLEPGESVEVALDVPSFLTTGATPRGRHLLVRVRTLFDTDATNDWDASDALE